MAAEEIQHSIKYFHLKTLRNIQNLVNKGRWCRDSSLLRILNKITPAQIKRHIEMRNCSQVFVPNQRVTSERTGVRTFSKQQ